MTKPNFVGYSIASVGELPRQTLPGRSGVASPWLTRRGLSPCPGSSEPSTASHGLTTPLVGRVPARQAT